MQRPNWYALSNQSDNLWHACSSWCDQMDVVHGVRFQCARVDRCSSIIISIYYCWEGLWCLWDNVTVTCESLIPAVISSNSFISVHCHRSTGHIASFVCRPLTIGSLLLRAFVQPNACIGAANLSWCWNIEAYVCACGVPKQWQFGFVFQSVALYSDSNMHCICLSVPLAILCENVAKWAH